jgi:menaquinone-dependent protoporphyrinogen oxidase
VKQTLETFFKQTGWHPTTVKPVAGALLYSKYNFLIRFVMKRVARKAGASTDASRDYDYTDWIGLDKFVEEWGAEIRTAHKVESLPNTKAG